MTSLYEAARDLMTTVEFAIKSGDWKVDGACDPTIDLVRLRQALAQPEQEPVAWYGVDDYDKKYLGWDKHDLLDEGFAWITPLYTAPPKREWVGITEDDVHHAFNYVEMDKCLDFDRDRQAWCETFAAHIEATLKQQNGFSSTSE